MTEPRHTNSGERQAVRVRAPEVGSRDELAAAVEWHAKMVLSRRFEEETERAFRHGKIGGYLHVYTGQEAVAAGFLAELRDDDIFFTGYRDHTHALLRGSPPGAVMAELYGKATGLAKGKGGSMHLFDVRRGFYGGYGIVGGHIPLATGAAYALRMHGTDRVCLCFLGDGAVNSGSFHEPVNMAGLWGRDGLCPIVYIIENNHYAMGTSVERSSAVTDLASRFAAYGIDHERAEGNDFLAVRRLAARAITQVRQSGRPFGVELLTYRYSGHGAADLFQPYRSKEEVAAQRHTDPILILESRLREARLLTDAQVARLHDEVEQTVQAAVRFAEESSPPSPAELTRDIYSSEA